MAQTTVEWAANGPLITWRAEAYSHWFCASLASHERHASVFWMPLMNLAIVASPLTLPSPCRFDYTV